MRDCVRWLIVMLLLVGCQDTHTSDAPSPPEQSSEPGTRFDAATTGAVRGRVVWQGALPDVPAFEVYASRDSQPDLPPRGPWPNPHAPRVDPRHRGIEHAVVYLREVERGKSRPWDHAPVRIEQEDWDLRIRQGSQTVAVGFVRQGDSIVAVSKQTVLHILRAQGAASFSLPFPTAEIESRKALSRPGHVELTSGAAYFWMRGHLFVADHPYYARTDAAGNFELTQVPAGAYQVVCWMPNWKVAWRERDAESSQFTRIGFAPPAVLQQQVTVEAGAEQRVDFPIGENAFAEPR